MQIVSPAQYVSANTMRNLKKDLQMAAEWASNETQNVSYATLKKFGERAADLLQKIQIAEQQLKQNANFIRRLGSTVETQNRHLNEIHQAHTLQVYLTQGYIFLKELKTFLTGEIIEYLILFGDRGSETIGKYTLEELLPTLSLVVNKDQEFALQIKKSKELQKLKKKKNTLNNTGTKMADKIIQLHYQIWEENIKIVRARRQQKAKEAGEADWEKRTGYKRGQAGNAFEIAANKVAKGLADSIRSKVTTAMETHQAEFINAAQREFNERFEEVFNRKAVQNIAEKEFHADTQAFYKAGDLSRELTALFTDAKNVVLELKRVSTSENTVGASLASQTVIQKALKKVIEAVSFSEDKDKVLEKLKHIFTAREKSLEEAIDDKVKEATTFQIE